MLKSKRDKKSDIFRIRSSNSSKEHFNGNDSNSDSNSYRKGQYYLVHPGETLNIRYIVEKKLGWGHFSTVWLATDTKTNSFVALKIQKSDLNYYEAAIDEIKFLKVVKIIQKVKEETHIVQLLDSFRIYNKKKIHVVMVFEVLGENLLIWIKHHRHMGIPLAVVKKIACQVLKGISSMHQVGIIHTDLKPENVLLTQDIKFNYESLKQNKNKKKENKKIRDINRLENRLERAGKKEKKRIKTKIQGLKRKIPKNNLNSNSSKIEKYPILFSWLSSEKNGKPLKKPSAIILQKMPVKQLKIIDLGNSCFQTKHFTEDITTRQYRAPEVILKAGYDTSCDIWSLTCLIFELFTGDYLFQPEEHKKYTRDEDHLALIMELIGNVPKILLKKGEITNKYFTKDYQLFNIKNLERWSLLPVLKQKYRIPNNKAELFTSFVLPMLSINPYKRPTALEALNHPWLIITPLT